MSAHEAEIVSSPSFLAPVGSNLTTKQNLFVQFYLEHRNGTKAARLAGYLGDVNSLGKQAHDNLNNPKIRDAIEQNYKSRLLSKDGVMAELSDIASAPWKEFVSVKTDDEGNVVDAQLRLTDKIKAAELVGKFHGLFIERSESVSLNIDLSGGDLASILQGALSAGAIDVTPEDTSST